MNLILIKIQTQKKINISKRASLKIYISKRMWTDFCLSFKKVYNYHITEIENKTRIKIKYIPYTILINISLFLNI